MNSKKYRKYLSLLMGVSLAFACCLPAQAQQHSESKAVVFLLDTSGSMKSNDPERLAVDSIAQFIYALPSNYEVGFVAYSEAVVAQQELIENERRSEIMDVAGALEYKGYSNAGAGLLCAVETLSETTAEEKCIVMLSDGEILMRKDAETTESSQLYQTAIERAEELEIPIHVIGLGDEMEDMNNSIFRAAVSTDGKSYRTEQALEIQAAIDAILNEELGIKQSTIAIVDGDGDLEKIAVELPYLHADKLRVLLTSTAPIQNLNTNFQAESARQINGARYSLIEIEHPSGGQLELSFAGEEGNQVRVNVIPEYNVIPKVEVVYKDSIPKVEELTPGMYYDRLAKINYSFYNAEKQSLRLWGGEYFDHNRIVVMLDADAEELTLNAGALTVEEVVTDDREYEVFFDYSRLPVNVIGTEGVTVKLEAPGLIPVEEPRPPYLLIGALAAGGVILPVLIIAILLHRRKKKRIPASVEERPEPSKYSYVGKINLYVTRTASGYDIPPLTYNLFRLPLGKVISLQEILEECEVREKLQGAEDIYFKAGANRNLILTNNSDCTIIKNREILMKKKSYQLTLDSKVDISFEDEVSELTFQYKDLKPSEAW